MRADTTHGIKERKMPKTILVVDDSPTDHRLMREPLEKRGYRILSAANGEEGLEAAKREKPDLILLDVIMPKLNGYQVCRQVKTTPETKAIKIVLISSKDQEIDKFWGLKQGADAYVT